MRLSEMSDLDVVSAFARSCHESPKGKEWRKALWFEVLTRMRALKEYQRVEKAFRGKLLELDDAARLEGVK